MVTPDQVSKKCLVFKHATLYIFGAQTWRVVQKFPNWSIIGIISVRQTFLLHK